MAYSWHREDGLSNKKKRQRFVGEQCIWPASILQGKEAGHGHSSPGLDSYFDSATSTSTTQSSDFSEGGIPKETELPPETFVTEPP